MLRSVSLFTRFKFVRCILPCVLVIVVLLSLLRKQLYNFALCKTSQEIWKKARTRYYPSKGKVLSTLYRVSNSLSYSDLSLHLPLSGLWIPKLLQRHPDCLSCTTLLFSRRSFSSFHDSCPERWSVFVSLNIRKYPEAPDLQPIDARPSLFLVFSIQFYGYYQLCVPGLEHSVKNLLRIIKRTVRSRHYTFRS